MNDVGRRCILFPDRSSMISPGSQTKSHVHRERLLKLILPVLATMIAFATGEVVLRQLRPDLGWHLQKDPLLGWTSGEYLEFDPLATPDTGSVRLLFLGDSFLAGSGITHLEERFPNWVGHRLAGVQVQIIAAGGWGTDQELLAYLVKGRSWQPDFVFLCLCANNDLSNNLSNSHGSTALMKPYFTLQEDGVLQLWDHTGHPLAMDNWPVSKKRASFRSHLLDYVRFRLGRITAQPPPWYADVDPRYQMFLRAAERSNELYALGDSLTWSPQDGVNHVSAYIHEPFPLNSYQWSLCEEMLRRLSTETAAQGAQLVVVLLPVTYRPRDPEFILGSPLEHVFNTPTGEFTFRTAEPNDRISGICSRLSIPLFDPADEFRRIVKEHHLEELCWFDPEDRHFSAVGHRIVANLLIDHLRESYPESFGLRGD
jgi:lysophospholipase L1-like esterase